MNLNQKKIDKITEINNLLLIENSNLKVIGFIEGEYKACHSRVIVKCKKHGLGCYFDNPWNPSYKNLKDGNGCPKCYGNYIPTTKEAITEINNTLLSNNTPLEVIGFIDGEYKNNKSRLIVKCKKHGLGCDFDNPWNPSYNNLKFCYACPKCYGNYIPTTKEAITEINNTLLSNNTPLEVIGFIDGEYKNNNSKLIVKCKEHGRGCDFDNPWNPSYKDLKSGSGCPKCSGNYVPTTKEAIREIKNQLLNKQPCLDVIRFVNGEYKNQKSKVIVRCKKHGKGCDFDNPWNPSYKNLKDGNGCPKCYGNYVPTTKESLRKIKDQLLNKHPYLEVIGFLNNEYKNCHSKVIIKCKEHGKGCDFESPWNPSYYNLKSGSGCPKCSIEKHDITELFKNNIHFNSKRNLYFITFKNLKTNEFFYKIGVTNEKGYKKRFNLKKDNIEIIESKEITTTNIFALLTEYYVITHFKEYKKTMFHVLKYNKGGSECFFYDLTKILTLEEMVDNAIINFYNLIENFDLTEKEIINAKKEFLKINNI